MRNGATSQIRRAKRNSFGFCAFAPRLALWNLASVRTCSGKVSGTMKIASREAARAIPAESRKGLEEWEIAADFTKLIWSLDNVDRLWISPLARRQWGGVAGRSTAQSRSAA